MSWQSYIDNLMSKKSLTGCGIFGLDGSLWASTQDFPVKHFYFSKKLKYFCKIFSNNWIKKKV